MKRLILSLAIVLVLIVSLAAPAFAASSKVNRQTWQFDSRNAFFSTSPVTISGAEAYAMEKVHGPNTNLLQNGHQFFAVGQSKIWVADEQAKANVTFPSMDWTLDVAADSNWQTQSGVSTNLVGMIGYTNGTTFTSFTDVDTRVTILGPVTDAGAYTIVQLTFITTNTETVPQGDWLAVKITNAIQPAIKYSDRLTQL
jgi:hypothetical protein